MKLFPHVLVRLGGGPFEILESLELDPNGDQSLREAQANLTALRTQICATLFEAGRQTQDNGLRRKLINLKRDLFNGRNLSTAKLTFLSEQFPQMAADLEAAVSRLDHEEALARKNFESQCTIIRNKLRQAVDHPALAKGLVLSSKTLAAKRKAYARSEKIGKREAKVELSLIKYLSRMCAKTSPFSTFTPLAMAKAADMTGPLLPHMPGMTMTNTVRLNNLLFKYLHGIMSLHPAYRDHFHIRANPTVKREHDHFLFLTNSDNVESFQRIPQNPVLDLFLELVGAQPEGLVFHALRTALADAVEADPQELNAYIMQLIDFGFLEPDLGISCIDTDWDLKLRELLSGLQPKPPFADDLIDTLDHLRILAHQFALADADARPKLQQTGYDRFCRVCRLLHEDAGLPQSDWDSPPAANDNTQKEQQDTFQRRVTTRFPLDAEQLFYEDCKTEQPAAVNANQVGEILTLLDKLQSLPICYPALQEERVRMHAWFKRQFNEPVDLLTFYESYYRHVRLAEEAPKFTEVEALSTAYQSISTALSTALTDSKINDQGEVHLSLDQLKHISAPLPPRNGITSAAAFLQCYSYQDKTMAVLNSGSSGFGRMFSRFLHLFDGQITQDILQCNEKAFPDCLTVEDCDASVFNANLHPPLAPHEIHAPGSWNNLPPEAQIPITDIQVESKNGRLIASRVSDGKQLEVLNLGFQSDEGRSELFLLLQYLSRVDYFDNILLLNAVNGHQYQKDDPIRKRPRIVLNQKLVLQRRAWLFDKSLLPTGSAKADLWDYRQQLLAWSQTHGLPDRFFVSAAARTEAGSNNKTAIVGRDDYKPQYMSFHNPILVGLFEKLTLKVPRVMKIEEMLPGPENLTVLGDKRHVNEIVAQGYRDLQINS